MNRIGGWVATGLLLVVGGAPAQVSVQADDGEEQVDVDIDPATGGIRVKSASGDRALIGYDAQGNVVVRGKDAAGQSATVGTDARGNVTARGKDAVGQAATVSTDARGSAVIHGTDAKGESAAVRSAGVTAGVHAAGRGEATVITDRPEQRVSYRCAAGESVAIQGVDSRADISGECGTVYVNAVDAQVQVESAARIVMNGLGSRAYWRRAPGGGKPAIEINAMRAEVLHDGSGAASAAGAVVSTVTSTESGGDRIVAASDSGEAARVATDGSRTVVTGADSETVVDADGSNVRVRAATGDDATGTGVAAVVGEALGAVGLGAAADDGEEVRVTTDGSRTVVAGADSETVVDTDGSSARVRAATGDDATGTTFTKSNAEFDYRCAQGEHLTLNGTNDEVEISGECGSLTVIGSNNDIEIDKVDAIIVRGSNNSVFWESGSTRSPPTVSQTGMYNEIEQH